MSDDQECNPGHWHGANCQCIWKNWQEGTTYMDDIDRVVAIYLDVKRLEGLWIERKKELRREEAWLTREDKIAYHGRKFMAEQRKFLAEHKEEEKR